MHKHNWLIADELIETQTLNQMRKIINYRKPFHIFNKIEIEIDLTISTNRARLQTVNLRFRWRGTRQRNSRTL